MSREIYLVGSGPAPVDEVIAEWQGKVIHDALSRIDTIESLLPSGVLGLVHRGLDRYSHRGAFHATRHDVEQVRARAAHGMESIEERILEKRSQVPELSAFFDAASSRNKPVAKRGLSHEASQEVGSHIMQIALVLSQNRPGEDTPITVFDSALPSLPPESGRVIVRVLERLGFRSYHFIKNVTRSPDGEVTTEAEIPAEAQLVGTMAVGQAWNQYTHFQHRSLLARYRQQGPDTLVEVVARTAPQKPRAARRVPYLRPVQ